MFEKIRIIFSIPELRQKILLTLSLLAVYRIGWAIPLPIVDVSKMTQFWASQGEGVAALVNQVSIFSGTQIEQITIFGLGIMPYISASIIFQLLATVYEPLEKLQKEGESGRKKINEYTRYATIVICLIQSYFYVLYITQSGENLSEAVLDSNKQLPAIWVLTAVMTMTAGTAFLMWLGEQIDEYGIGNGISLLIMAGILANLPEAVRILGAKIFKDGGVALGGDGAGQVGVERLLVLAALFVAVVVGVIYVTKGQRRIPTQSAKHVRGRKVYGGNRQYLPLKVNQAGVMPIIFASSLLLFPMVFFQFLYGLAPSEGMIRDFFHVCIEIFNRQTYTYILLYVGLIFFFCYFWTAVTFNPKDMADNLKNYGTFIPGYRPGRRTAEYLEKVMIRITYVGAAFLALIAIIPSIISSTILGNFDGSLIVAGFFGGTSLLIVVSVIIDLVDKIDSHLIMRNYKGLLDKTGSSS
ncbi:MAG TPA: preprotein translocase subunit SecY [Planctomycetaceae bacterium]|nr:preprotein translocase subunit SecY [Planctomycetaceae bacterium]